MPETIHVTLLLFAGLKEAVGSARVTLSLQPEATCSQVKSKLLEEYPSAKRYSSQLLVARDSVYLSDAEIINDDDELACFPPVSGG